MTPERIQKLRAVLDLRQTDLTVITDHVHKSRNLSAIVRTCDAVGIGKVHTVILDNDYKAFKGTAQGCHRWVKVVRHRSLIDAVQPLADQGFQVVAAHLSEQAVDFRSIDYTKPTALLLGAERVGVSESGSSLADVHITVPMMGMVSSLNVSVAAGIILAEVQRQRQQAGQYDYVHLDSKEYQKLFFEWGHPQVRHYCEAHGLDYPTMREDGEIDNPSAWYASVKDVVQKRRAQKK